MTPADNDAPTAWPMLMTEAQAAEFVHHSRATLARERRLGRLPYVRGRPPLIWREDLLTWLARRRVDVADVMRVPGGISGIGAVRAANRAALKIKTTKTTRTKRT